MTQIAPSAPQMLVSNVVQLVNEGPEQFRMKYGPTQWLELEPGARILVNEDVAWHFLGRWWADNSNKRERARVGEVNRLRTLYGSYEDDIAWRASRAFWLKCYTPDGKQIVTVVDDPEGEMMVGGQTPIGREMSLESQVEVLTQHLLQLQAQVNDNTRREAEQQDRAPTDTQPVPSPPYNPAAPPFPVPTVAGVSVPVAPAPVGLPPTVGIPATGNTAFDPDADELGIVGGSMPVRPGVAYDPSEQPAPEDTPQVVKQTAQGGRVG